MNLRVGILDTKAGSYAMENAKAYKEHGYKVISKAQLDREQFDIVATMWTPVTSALSYLKAVVVKDGDEPENVVNLSECKRYSVAVEPVGNWGISTRVAWNSQWLADRERIAIVAQTPTHDVLSKALCIEGKAVSYPLSPIVASYSKIIVAVQQADAVVVHLGKRDYRRFWLDWILPAMKQDSLLIPTTRGALYSADALNRAVRSKAPSRAVLDWAWQEEQLDPVLLESGAIKLTEHTSYRSDQSREELTKATIEAVERAANRIAH